MLLYDVQWHREVFGTCKYLSICKMHDGSREVKITKKREVNIHETRAHLFAYSIPHLLLFALTGTQLVIFFEHPSTTNKILVPQTHVPNWWNWVFQRKLCKTKDLIPKSTLYSSAPIPPLSTCKFTNHTANCSANRPNVFNHFYILLYAEYCADHYIQ